MTLLRSIPIATYLLLLMGLLVVLPWVHMPVHAHDHEPAMESATCEHGHHEKPAPQTPDHEEHDCRLCELIVLPANKPQAFELATPVFTLIDVLVAVDSCCNPSLPSFYQARAPPLKTA